MHAINGRVYCNLPSIEARVGERVRWQLISVGSELDLHSVSWRDLTVRDHGRREFSVRLYAGATRTVDTNVAFPGTSLIQCNVFDHRAAGMMATFSIKNVI